MRLSHHRSKASRDSTQPTGNDINVANTERNKVGERNLLRVGMVENSIFKVDQMFTLENVSKLV